MWSGLGDTPQTFMTTRAPAVLKKNNFCFGYRNENRHTINCDDRHNIKRAIGDHSDNVDCL